mmetsp:Transcript_29861/g.71006  ORF Transcript_29861/g.71006 Transcript_29861/m.71006 type:complete len:125 (+) Transcript_29861:42-416(+)
MYFCNRSGGSSVSLGILSFMSTLGSAGFPPWRHGLSWVTPDEAFHSTTANSTSPVTFSIRNKDFLAFFYSVEPNLPCILGRFDVDALPKLAVFISAQIEFNIWVATGVSKVIYHSGLITIRICI